MFEILGFVFLFSMPFLILGIPLYFFLKIYAETKRLKAEIITKANACSVIPTKILPFSRFSEAQLSDLVDYHVVSNEVQRIVSEGKTEYASHTVLYLSEMFKSYVITNYVWRRHPRLLFWTGMHWFGLVMVGLQAHAASKLELIFNQYLRGTLVKSEAFKSNTTNMNNSFTSSADEIVKLHKLKQEGILSDEEFQNAKKKLVG